ncbi:MAG TPA: MarR family winged helix-turn-helix transcriptional regulator, partial [Caulobacter sp.]|nr:MarR family winged helix-turn-helix transcriptional regulator [Caulobacter sp.]
TSVDPGDSRVRRVVLTPAGHARLAAALPIWTRTHAAVEAGLADGDPDRLRGDLLTLAAAKPDAATPPSCSVPE